MKLMTLDEMREHLQMPQAWIVRDWKAQKPVNGQLIKNEMRPEGRVWWLEPEGGATALEVSEPEDTSPRLKDSGVHGRTVGALERAGIETVNQLLRLLSGTVSRHGAVAALRYVEGVGEKGALDTLTWLAGLGLWVDTAEEIDSAPEATDEIELVQSTIGTLPAFLYDLGSLEDAKLAKEAILTALSGKVPCVDGMSKNCREQFLAWHSNRGKEHQITCPHCTGLFDTLTETGGYGNAIIKAKCTADAEYQTVQGQAQGNCGAEFWIEPTTTGYLTHKQDPVVTSEVQEGAKNVEIDVATTPVPAEIEADAVVEAPEVSRVGKADVSDASDGEVQNESETARELPVRDQPPAVAVQNAPRAVRPTVPLHERIHPGLSECRSVGTFQHDTPEWHAARQAGVGSSDAGAILGLSPHATTQDIWKTKVGEEASNKPWLENYSSFGTWFEKYIREWAEEASGVEIIDGATLGTLQSIHWPQARANIDGIDQYGTLEEYKTTSERWAEIPQHYEAQVQHQLFVTGADTARIRQFVSPVNRDIIPSLLESMRELAMFPEEADRRIADWLIKNGEFYTYIIERDEKYIDRLVEQEKLFWGFVESNVIPPFADPDGTIDLSGEPEVYAAVEEFARLAGVLESFKPHTEKADEHKKKARQEIARVLALLGETPKRLTIGSHKATFVVTKTHSYWNIFTGEVEDVVPF